MNRLALGTVVNHWQCTRKNVLISFTAHLLGKLVNMDNKFVNSCYCTNVFSCCTLMLREVYNLRCLRFVARIFVAAMKAPKFIFSLYCYLPIVSWCHTGSSRVDIQGAVTILSGPRGFYSVSISDSVCVIILYQIDQVNFLSKYEIV